MKIMITGASGLVGRNVVANSKMQKNELFFPSSKELNLLDYDAVFSFLAKTMPELIIHCAGKVGGIVANIKDKYGFFTQNAVMGMNIVRAAKKAGVKKILNLSSACVYPKECENPLKEEFILKAPLDFALEGYALAKLCVMRMCEYASKECPECQYKTLILCNLYGKWDKFGEENSNIIPSIIKKIHFAKLNGISKIEIWGSGSARREVMYAEDLSDLILFCIENWEKIPLLMNAGLGYDFSVNEYYEAAKKIVGYEGNFVHDLLKPVGTKQKLLDIERLQKLG